ncbi:MAG: Amino acid racemase [Candidatus Magnetoglobus multicellularis str. Araruama]|uniref:Amino acid racemase n=1 Tax=Candidatus Magnetoglobus multicellularis str. Araruama TaxID=890399 RepID=A0A1V1PFH7_9BACT|nr:MAG: Amino acid racemase [Candidatus Magnetoglobus multicellularis str. Araruama]
MKLSDQITGILGGMGPLASSEFVKTIYEQKLNDQPEQYLPNVIMHSIPTIPDRTQAIYDHSESGFFPVLNQHLNMLYKANVTKIIICCVTSHYFLPDISKVIFDKIISLLTVGCRELARIQVPALLLATKGTYLKQLFEKEAEFNDTRKYLVIPSDEDKDLIHNLIYDHLKKGTNISEVYNQVKWILDKYHVKLFIAGCTEFHLLAKYMLERGETDCFIDPLMSIAKDLIS